MGPGEPRLISHAMISTGHQHHAQRQRRDGDVERALDEGVDALQRDVVEIDDRNAVQVLEPRAEGDELQQVGHDLDVHALAAGRFDQVQQLQVFFERQRHVEVVHLLARRDVGGLGQRAEQRQPAVAEVVAAGAIVHEADDLIAKFAMLENLVGHHAAEIAGAGNQDAAQADAGDPAAFQRLADELARQVAEPDVADEEQPPDELRDLVNATVLQLVRDVVGLEVQRADHAEDDGEDAADEHVEEVVDARASASQAVEALQVEARPARSPR